MKTVRLSTALLIGLNATILISAANATTDLRSAERNAVHTTGAVPASQPSQPHDVQLLHHKDAPVPARRQAPIHSAPVPAKTTSSSAIAAAVSQVAATLVPPAYKNPAPSASGPTGWAELNQAIARIPGYVPGSIKWQVSNSYGSWGTADMGNRVIYISPNVPSANLYDVAVHEWSHIRSVDPYDGDAQAAVAAMNRYYHASGMNGAEEAADCMAILQGAHWTHYTSCTNSSWRAGAARLLRGERL